MPHLVRGEFQASEEYLRALVLGGPGRGKAHAHLGGKSVRLFESVSRFNDHLAKHFLEFNIAPREHEDLVDVTSSYRLTSKDDQVECRWSNVRWFRHDDVSIAEYIAHVVNDHQLPILKNGTGEVVQIVERVHL